MEMNVLLLCSLIPVAALWYAYSYRPFAQANEKILLMTLKSGTDIMVPCAWLSRARFPHQTRVVTITKIPRPSRIERIQLGIQFSLQHLPAAPSTQYHRSCLVIGADGTTVLCVYNTVMRAWRVHGNLSEIFI